MTSAADQARELLRFYITETMHSVAGNPALLARVVADGPSSWRNTFSRAFRGLPVDDAVADSLFGFFAQQFIRQYAGQTPSQVLDSYAPPAPPSEHEINDGWEVDSSSSEDGKRHFYGKDSSPQQYLEKLKQGAQPHEIPVIH